MRGKLFLISLVLMTILALNFVSADIMIPGTRSLNHTVKIVNLDEFPEYTFFLKNYGVMPSDRISVFKSNELEPKAYKFSSFSLCATSRTDLDLENLKLEELWNNLSLEQKNEALENEEEFYDFSQKPNISKIDGIVNYLEKQINNDSLDGWREKEVERNYRNFAQLIFLNSPETKKTVTCFDNKINHYSLVPILSLKKKSTQIFEIFEDNNGLNLNEGHKTQYSFIITGIFLVLVLIVSLIEWGIFEWILRKEEKTNKLFPRVLAVNLITVIIANQFPMGFLPLFILIELGIIFIEAIAFKYLLNLKFIRALGLSAVANFITAILSFIFTYFPLDFLYRI